jgi:hypothetical protein
MQMSDSLHKTKFSLEQVTVVIARHSNIRSTMTSGWENLVRARDSHGNPHWLLNRLKFNFLKSAQHHCSSSI